MNHAPDLNNITLMWFFTKADNRINVFRQNDFCVSFQKMMVWEYLNSMNIDNFRSLELFRILTFPISQIRFPWFRRTVYILSISFLKQLITPRYLTLWYRSGITCTAVVVAVVSSRVRWPDRARLSSVRFWIYSCFTSKLVTLVKRNYSVDTNARISIQSSAFF